MSWRCCTISAEGEEDVMRELEKRLFPLCSWWEHDRSRGVARGRIEAPGPDPNSTLYWKYRKGRASFWAEISFAQHELEGEIVSAMQEVGLEPEVEKLPLSWDI